MKSTLEKQISELKSTIFIPLIMLGVAWVVFFALSFAKYPVDEIHMSLWLSIQIPVVVGVSALYIALFIPHIKAYKTLKALPKNPPAREVTIHCQKVKFLNDGHHKINCRRFCGVIFVDEHGQKYTYILEQSLWYDKENATPYRQRKGCTVTLICYADTNMISHIKG